MLSNGQSDQSIQKLGFDTKSRHQNAKCTCLLICLSSLEKKNILFHITTSVHFQKKKKKLDGSFVLVMETKHLYNVIIPANNLFLFFFTSQTV